MTYKCMCGKTLKSANQKHFNTRYHERHAPINYTNLYNKHFGTNTIEEEQKQALLDNTPLCQDIINLIIEFAKDDTLEYHEKSADELKLMQSYPKQVNSIIEKKLLGSKISKKMTLHLDRCIQIYEANHNQQ